MLTFGMVGLFSLPSLPPFDWIFLLLNVSSLLVEGVAFKRGSAFFWERVAGCIVSGDGFFDFFSRLRYGNDDIIIYIVYPY
jgi:hypothetical protein